MKIACCLFKFFAFGGLQRDFLRIANECIKRGHSIDVYTMEWIGEKPSNFAIHVIPVNGWQNHSRAQQFADKVQQKLLAQEYDLVVGFNKMPGLDVYYAADTCYQAKATSKPWWYRLLPRYRHLVNFEKSVFKPDSLVEILLIASQQQGEFERYYQTPAERFHLLPPGIDRDRIASADSQLIRQKIRSQAKIAENDYLLLMVGSGFKTKGLDRIINGIAALPDNIKGKTSLWIVGNDHAESFLTQAKQLGISERIDFLGGRNDVPQLLLAADILLHPAYNENTGTVLLEALAAGLPVLTTDVCGYAKYIEQADAGRVLPSPFNQALFNQALKDMLLSPKRQQWRLNALEFTKTADIYSLPARAVDILELL